MKQTLLLLTLVLAAIGIAGSLVYANSIRRGPEPECLWGRVVEADSAPAVLVIQLDDETLIRPEQALTGPFPMSPSVLLCLKLPE